MIYLKSETVARLDQTLPGLHRALQQAIELEHAVLPPYLYSLYSLVPGKNQQIADLLLSIILEEMLHMALVCNILNAIGGAPEIDKPDFIPAYPGPLPGGIENGVNVRLACFSKKLVKEVFMAIEEPEEPLKFPVVNVAFLAAPAVVTIGQFYKRIKEQMIELSTHDNIFTGRPDYQLTQGLPSTRLIPVVDVQSACQAIATIVEQGEGTPLSPLDPQQEPAHYYRFAEIFYGRALVPDPAPLGFAYAGAIIPFNESGVYPVKVNPRAATYPSGSAARKANDAFNYTYTGLLKVLHTVFNGQPDCLSAGVGLMESLKEQALTMMSSISAGRGLTAGPSFEYQPINP
jgi:hypothetical protein